MNCANCGAAMRFVPRRSYLVCDYCTTFHFPGSTESTLGMTLLERGSNRNCPVCAAELVAAAIEGCEVEFCRTCRGVLTANGDFAYFIRRRREQFDGVQPEPVPLDPTEYERQIDCPACGSRMDVHPYYGPGNVVIDTCGRCCLIWFDHGELAAIEAAPSTDSRTN